MVRYSAAAGVRCAKMQCNDDDRDGRQRGRMMVRTSDGEEWALAMSLS